MKKRVALLLSVACLLSVPAGCSEDTTDGTQSTTSTPTATAITAVTDEEMFTKRDLDAGYDEKTAIAIQLSGNTAKASDASVSVSGAKITITKEATYVISGSLTDGSLVVAAPDTAKLQLVFNGASVTSSASAPLYVKTADKVFVTLVGDNTLTGGDSFMADGDINIDGAVFSKQDITFNGSGTLTVSSPAGHGIVGKDDVVFTGGSYTITSASHGVQANDSVRIQKSTFTTNAGKDGIHAENAEDTAKGFVYVSSGTLNIESQGDGISAGAYMQVQTATVNITAGGGYQNGDQHSSEGFGQFGGGGMPGGPGGGRPEGRPQRPGGAMPTAATITTTQEDDATSMKGLKAGTSLLIINGTFTVDSADDGFHANGSAQIKGGTFTVASGDDAFHGEETLTVSGGTINITNSYEGLEALHIAVAGGDIQLVASDDGLNAAGGTDQSGGGGRDQMPGMPGGGMHGAGNGSIVISGGKLYIQASGDGIDANGTLEITGGDITLNGPTNGDTAVLDYDATGTISGGTFMGTGSSMMAQTLTGSGQGVLAMSVGQQSAGTAVTIQDTDGNQMVSHAPKYDYQIVIFSSAKIKAGATYTVTVGDQSSQITAE